MIIDYFSAYKYTVRNVILRKQSNIFNSNQIPCITRVVYSFRLHKLEDLDDVQIYNYLYFFKFFFGKRGSLTKYKSFFNLGLWTYTFRVCMYVYGSKHVYYNLYTLFFDYLVCIDKNLLNLGFFTGIAKIYYIIIKELTYFSEQKTNIGLFNLNNSLLVSCHLSSKNQNINKLLPKNMKLIINNLWYIKS